MSDKIKDVVKRLRDRAEARRRSGKLLQIDDRMFDLIADEIEAAVKVLEADRDNWRRQALDEDARANAINSAANANVDAKVYSKSEMIESVVKAATQAVQLTNEKFARSVGNAAEMRDAANSELLNSINSYQINSSKAREALEKCLRYLDIGEAGLSKGECDVMRKVMRDALSNPPRNCDIGTVREQDFRFNDFCGSHDGCDNCPLHKGIDECAIEWGQMPYKKGATDEQ